MDASSSFAVYKHRNRCLRLARKVSCPCEREGLPRTARVFSVPSRWLCHARRQSRSEKVRRFFRLFGGPISQYRNAARCTVLNYANIDDSTLRRWRFGPVPSPVCLSAVSAQHNASGRRPTTMSVNAVPMGDRPFATDRADDQNDTDVFTFMFFACCVELFLFKFFSVESPRWYGS